MDGTADFFLSVEWQFSDIGKAPTPADHIVFSAGSSAGSSGGMTLVRFYHKKTVLFEHNLWTMHSCPVIQKIRI